MKERLLNFLNEQDVKYKISLLSDLSSIKIGGAAAIASPESINGLIDLVDLLEIHHLPYKIVGRMTNILPCDEDYNGVIIQTNMLRAVEFHKNGIKALSGASFSRLLLNAAQYDLGGAEELYGIPGSLGGMITMNAGAFGAEIADIVTSVEVYDPISRKRYTLTRTELDFSYRSSKPKKSGLVVLSAALQFKRKNKYIIKDGFSHYMSIRRSAQPCGEPSLGSIFKKHELGSVSYLIDKAGLKGCRIGGAVISEKHAGFIVNRGGAKASDVTRLIEFIKTEIYNKFGIVPEEEIEYL